MHKKVSGTVACLLFGLSSSLVHSLPCWATPSPLEASQQLAFFGFGKKKDREAEEKRRTQVVKVTNAQVRSENIAGAWFYTLEGTVSNQTPAAVRSVLIYYEVVSPETGKLVDAGSVKITPETLQNGGQGQFSATPKTSGKVRITLIEWLTGDRTYGSFNQMETFP